ncbi:glycine-rich selenoprotein-like [Harmonia axyridis]|uniref:glycine-rich selenoprotein-like n=1 Tax=Harmonia axyridis TaxID=115357 RepID=UPI001E2762B5|nr:glycine-rich selenoprotein-like [Harmonia axyridis]
MVYIARDGTVCENPPWGIDRIGQLFSGLINFVVLFFQTLVGLDTSQKSTQKSGGSSFRSGGGGGGGGGGGRPFGPGGGGGSGPKKFMTLRDVNPPTVGGCPGGACGR